MLFLFVPRRALLVMLLFAFLICACKKTQPVEDTKQSVSPEMPIYPAQIDATPSLELGQLIYMLMPEPNQSIGWDWAVDSSIIWIDEGYINSNDNSIRRGIVRVNVVGKKSTVLRRKKEELGWTVTLFSSTLPKFGPDKILIEPGLKDDFACFGSLFDGCEFDPLPSLKNAGINIEFICKDTDSEANFEKIYKLNAPKKLPIFIKWTRSEGSGGVTTDVTMYLKEQENICKTY